MSRRTVHLRHSIEILTDIAPRFAEAWRMHQEHRPALPGATAVDPTGTSGRGPSDPTGDTAMLGQQTGHDRRTAELDQAIRDLIRATTIIDTFVRANTPRTATAKDRRDAEAANAGDPECFLMRRHADTFEPVLCESDLGGLLEHPLPVSRWVHDFARRTGRLPTRAECLQHARGQRVMIHQASDA